MKLRRYISGMLAATLAAATFTLSGVAFAAEGAQTAATAAAGTAAAGAAGSGTATPASGENAGAQEKPVVFTYKHTSARYGYSIFCPSKPKVLPASAYNENDKGEMLIFRGTYDNIRKGWMICINGYDNKVIPDNLGTMEEAEAKQFLEDFSATYGLAYAQIVEIPNQNADGTPAEGSRYGICGPTAMEVQIDTDGDGVMDSVATADRQMMRLFIPGQYGGHFALGLMEEGELKQQDVTEFLNAGLFTLQQWPTNSYDKAKEEAKKNSKKK